MILMEHEWSVRDVCFLFCLDYPEVIFFSSVRFTLVPPRPPLKPLFFLSLITVLTSGHVSYRNEV